MVVVAEGPLLSVTDPVLHIMGDREIDLEKEQAVLLPHTTRLCCYHTRPGCPYLADGVGPVPSVASLVEVVVCEESSSSCPAAGAGAAAVLLCCCTAGAGEGSDGGCSVDGAVLAAWRIKIERNK